MSLSVFTCVLFDVFDYCFRCWRRVLSRSSTADAYMSIRYVASEMIVLTVFFCIRL